MIVVDLQRFRKLEAGDDFAWRWDAKDTDDEATPTEVSDGHFDTELDALQDFFRAITGDDTIRVGVGIPFPDGFGPIEYVSDDLYRVTRSDDAA